MAKVTQSETLQPPKQRPDSKPPFVSLPLQLETAHGTNTLAVSDSREIAQGSTRVCIINGTAYRLLDKKPGEMDTKNDIKYHNHDKK